MGQSMNHGWAGFAAAVAVSCGDAPLLGPQGMGAALREQSHRTPGAPEGPPVQSIYSPISHSFSQSR